MRKVSKMTGINESNHSRDVDIISLKRIHKGCVLMGHEHRQVSFHQSQCRTGSSRPPTEQVKR